MLEPTENQFGFKQGVGCSHAIYTVRNNQINAQL